MEKVVNIEQCFKKFSDTFSPKIVGELNGQHVKLVRLEGDKVPWHTHAKEDELFLVVDGVLDVLEKEGSVTLHAGEFYIVYHGREHRIVPRGHVKLILFEPDGLMGLSIPEKCKLRSQKIITTSLSPKFRCTEFQLTDINVLMNYPGEPGLFTSRGCRRCEAQGL